MTEFVALMTQRHAAYITAHALYNALIDPVNWAKRLEALDHRIVACSRSRPTLN